MRRTVLAALAFLWVTAVPADAADWISLRTPHFLFIGDATAGDVRDVALRFEQFREAVTTGFPLFADDTPGPPVVVFVFRNEKSYEPFLARFNGKPVKVGGYYLAGRDVNYITMAANSRGPEFQTVYHGAVANTSARDDLQTATAALARAVELRQGFAEAARRVRP